MVWARVSAAGEMRGCLCGRWDCCGRVCIHGADSIGSINEKRRLCALLAPQEKRETVNGDDDTRILVIRTMETGRNTTVELTYILQVVKEDWQIQKPMSSTPEFKWNICYGIPESSAMVPRSWYAEWEISNGVIRLRFDGYVSFALPMCSTSVSLEKKRLSLRQKLGGEDI